MYVLRELADVVQFITIIMDLNNILETYKIIKYLCKYTRFKVTYNWHCCKTKHADAITVQYLDYTHVYDSA